MKTKGFAGFPPGKLRFTPIPNLFFSELLPAIDDLAELKVTLYLFWRLSQKKRDFYVSFSELSGDELLLESLRGRGRDPVEALREGLERAVARGTFLHLQAQGEDGREDYYFLNSEKGRLTAEKARRGEVPLRGCPEGKVTLALERPNIFVLYEQNIGLISPLIAEELLEAEKTYPPEWIEEAFKIAVEQNVRRWGYVRRILERWAAEGKDDGKGKRPPEEDRRRYIEGEYAKYIKH